MSPLYSSKDAPRSLFSNAPRFISFEQLLMALRAHLWTVALEKNSQNTHTRMRTFLKKKIRNAIILIKRREVITRFIVSVYNSKDAPRPCLSNALTLRSFEQFLVSLRAQLWTLSTRKKNT